MADRDVLVALAERVARGEPTVLATAVRTEGAPPCRIGNKLLLGPGGPVAGTLGCAELDAAALDEVGSRLAEGQPALRTFTHELGSVEVYLEPHASRPVLVVVGATPVATYLLRWAAELGYDSALVERRDERVTPEQRTLAGAVVADAASARLSGGAALVHTDHDAPGLVDDVESALRAGVGFVGVMGSARHTGPHLDQLRARGVAEADVGRVQTPVGLDLGGRTAPEIALAILAGVVATRHGRPAGFLGR